MSIQFSLFWCWRQRLFGIAEWHCRELLKHCWGSSPVGKPHHAVESRPEWIHPPCPTYPAPKGVQSVPKHVFTASRTRWCKFLTDSTKITQTKSKSLSPRVPGLWRSWMFLSRLVCPRSTRAEYCTPGAANAMVIGRDCTGSCNATSLAMPPPRECLRGNSCSRLFLRTYENW